MLTFALALVQVDDHHTQVEDSSTSFVVVQASDPQVGREVQCLVDNNQGYLVVAVH